MNMRLIYQDHIRPSRVLEALISLIGPELSSLRFAVAYTTYGGVTDLVPRIRLQATDPVWANTEKVLVTSFDMGITDPAALRYLQQKHGFAIRISDVNEAKANYHPKIYIVGRKESSAVLMGSANLSSRALAGNTEIVALYDPYPEMANVEAAWAAILDTSHALTPEELQEYEANRPKRVKKAAPDASVPPELLPQPGELPVFAQEVEAGMNPMAFDALWVEAGLVSGGSQSQVELPRAANRFFGANFLAYGQKGVTPIIDVSLVVGPITWTRPLRWHGDNRMERINLPTPAQSGLQYSGHAVLFRRNAEKFTIEVALENSTLANSWIEASRQLGTLFRVGERTNRRCGLLEPQAMSATGLPSRK
jgi:HKD family nuclease